MATLRLDADLDGFRYFWGKAVTGFKPTFHCAKCLEGDYIKPIKAKMKKGSISFGGQGDVVYICGVSAPYRWENNFHLAVVVDDQAEPFTSELYTGQAISVSGMRRIDFDESAAKDLYPGKGKNFLTCRNFQFGAQYFRRP